MDSLRAFFALNRDLIYFVYGLVFFVLGLAIALQSRRYSRLDLARSLSWLAAFGFAHGFHEWGDLFIPIQATYLSAGAIHGLYALHLLLLAISFACLFEFGVALLRPLGRLRWLHGLPAGLIMAWALAVFFILPAMLPDPEAWYHGANTLARYSIGFPGGLLAAYALRQHSYERIAPLNAPTIVTWLRLAGIALALYAVFGGLIAPPLPVFPANVINTETFEQAFGVPPMVVRSLVGLFLAVTIIRALDIFALETRRIIESMEQQHILAAERERLGRELHDGAIQSVYTAGLLVESAQYLAEPGSPVAARLDRAMVALNDAILDLRRSLSELRGQPGEALAEPLAAALRRITEDPRFRSMVDVRLTLDLPEDETLSPVRANHILAIVNEALSNAVRHARASQVAIDARRSDGRLCITLHDDGIGLPRAIEPGYGLRNMRDRARLLGGRLEVTSPPGKGTTVEVDVPWKDER